LPSPAFSSYDYGRHRVLHSFPTRRSSDLLLTPPGAVPDLELVVDARARDLELEAGVLDQRRREHQPALPIELALRGAGEEVAPHAPRVLSERVESRDPVCEPLPLGARVGVEAAVEAARDDDAVLERGPELGREGEAVLVVKRM